MKRYFEITHTYVIGAELSEEDATLDPVLNSGVSMMEAHIQGLFQEHKEIRSNWKMMPADYNPDAPVEWTVERFEDEAGIFFTEDVPITPHTIRENELKPPPAELPPAHRQLTMGRPDRCPKCGESTTSHTGTYCQKCGEVLV